MMREVRVEEAVGHVLGHDLTKIVPGKFKGAAFSRGHIIRESDVSELLKMGKEHIYILEISENFLHENEAAVKIAKAIKGEGLTYTDPVEGKVSLVAERKGLLTINKDVVHQINYLGDIALATLHPDRIVSIGEKVAGTRVIPLTIEGAKIKKVEEICANNSSVLQIKPLNILKTGIITTGNEVYQRRIKDEFSPVVKKKIEALGGSVYSHVILSDDIHSIKNEILKMRAEGLDFIMVTGGMSVDPDDRTPGAIKETGARIVSYGTPVLPGNMFMLAYLGDVPIVGLPGCVMYAKATIFDLMLPLIFAGQKINKADIASLGVGGLCQECEDCTFPRCSFGKIS